MKLRNGLQRSTVDEAVAPQQSAPWQDGRIELPRLAPAGTAQTALLLNLNAVTKRFAREPLHNPISSVIVLERA
jgi:hypothetical protein